MSFCISFQLLQRFRSVQPLSYLPTYLPTYTKVIEVLSPEISKLKNNRIFVSYQYSKAMLVKNIKCTVCGANKVTQNKSMYIFCDYCGAWMGYDMDAAGREAMEVFSPENMSNPDVKEWTKLNTESIEASKAHDRENYIKLKLRLNELDFILFPSRFGPKGKQSSYRNKYMEYHKKMYEETITESYFEKINKPPTINTDNLKYTVVDGVVVYEYDEGFYKFIDDNIEIMKESFVETAEPDYLKYHPEYDAIRKSDLMYKITIGAFIQAFPNETSEKIIEHLGMTDDFITIPDVNITEQDCIICSAKLSVADGAKSIVCEECGCKNEITTSMVSCPNCAAGFDPSEGASCPYCNSKIERPKSMTDMIKEKYQEVSQESNGNTKKSKKGFFAKLFGG